MDPYTVYYPRENRNLCASPVNGICSEVDKRWENVRATMGYIRSYADRMNLIAMAPRNTLSSTEFALANTAAVGSELLVYSPSGGGFSVNLSHTTRTFSVEWLNPATGVKTAAGTVRGGSASQAFNPPFSGDAVLYLVDNGS
jgi:collagenase-like protein with putative collagen-binding domain